MSDQTVKVLLFSTLRERVGLGNVELVFSGPVNLSVLFDRLCRDYPAIEPYADYVRVAINGTYANWESVIHDGDEVALVTPVSGG